MIESDVVLAENTELPREVSDLIASVSDPEVHVLLKRCADEWWPVLSGKKLTTLHVVMTRDYVYPDLRNSHAELYQEGIVIPEGEYRIPGRHEIWQDPPRFLREEGPMNGVEIKTWCADKESTLLIPKSGIYQKNEWTHKIFGLASTLGTPALKVRTAARLGTLVLSKHQIDGASLVCDFGIRHAAQVMDASPVPTLFKIWIDRNTAKPARALFLGGDINLDIHWLVLEKDQPISADIFTPPADLGREGTLEELVGLLFAAVSPDFPLPEKGSSEYMTYIEKRLPMTLGFWAGIVYNEDASENDWVASSGSNSQMGGDTNIEYDASGVSIELLEGEPWKDVRVILNSDLGPEAYTAHIEEVTLHHKITIPYSEFRNPQGYRYVPRNIRTGRTIIKAGDKQIQGITWENCL